MLKTWTTRALLAFVLFTLGFGVGREVGRRQTAASTTAAASAPAAQGAASPATAHAESKVVVYYLHATFRCVTCNTIERLAKQTLDDVFADDLAAGRIEWRTADFQEREDLAKRYDVASSTVVVVRCVDGQETGFRRLDDVWTLVNKPAEFREYIAAAIREYLR